MEQETRKPSKAVVVSVFFTICCVIPIAVTGPIYQGMFGVSTGLRESNFTATCAGNMRKVGVSLEQYSLDNNGAFPPGDKWMDLTWKYVSERAPENESGSCYRCPVVWRSKQQGFGYALNTSVLGVLAVAIRDEDPLPIVFESTNILENAVADPSTLPVPPRHENRGTRLNHGVNQNGGLMEFTGPFLNPRKKDEKVNSETEESSN